jgi:trehalose synthase
MTTAPRRKLGLPDAYRPLCPEGTREELENLASGVAGRTLLHLYAPGLGEDLSRGLRCMSSLLETLGVQARWDVLVGTEEFFEAARILRKALAGEVPAVSAAAQEAYVRCLRNNADRIYLGADVVVVHDVQPVGLVEWRPGRAPWVWRCHFDPSRASRDVWPFFRPFLSKYDAAIVSHSRFSKGLPVPAHVIRPSLDPLHDRNRDLSPDEVERVAFSLGLPPGPPTALILCRPEGAVECAPLAEALLELRGSAGVRPVVAVVGSARLDGMSQVQEIRRCFEKHRGVAVLFLDADQHLLVNGVCRAATVCVRPLEESGLDPVLLELMWKAKPVVAGPGAGRYIPVTDGKTGFVARSPRQAANAVGRILADPARGELIGRNARELVRERYLVTRHVRDYLVLLRRLREKER